MCGASAVLEGMRVCKGLMRTAEDVFTPLKIVPKHLLRVAFNRNDNFFCRFAELRLREGTIFLLFISILLLFPEVTPLSNIYPFL